MAELVERGGLGATVDAEDSEGFAAACAALLDDPALRAQTASRVEEAAAAFRWEEAARPLVEYCLEGRERPAPRKHPVAIAIATYGQYPGILVQSLTTEGPAQVARRMARHLARALRHGA